jgi:ATP-dependent DNA helicase RecG
MKDLKDSVQFLPGVGPQRLKLFQRIGINRIYDLLYYLPRKYLDRSQVKTIKEASNDINSDEEVTVKGRIIDIIIKRLRYHKSIFEIIISDETEELSAIWFNQPFLQGVFSKGQEVILSGKIKVYKYPQLSSPEYEIIPANNFDNFLPLHTQGIIPCYSLTEGLTQKFMRRTIKNCLAKYLSSIEDIGDTSLIARHGFMSVQDALNQIHFPESEASAEKARQRLVYDELFIFNLILGLKRYQKKKTPVQYSIKISEQLDERIRKRIPFQLTQAQEKTIQEIKSDLIALHPMNRLLQGDVGSGKTIVAVYAILAAIGNGLQVALMAPTEILAEQHYRAISKLLTGSRVRMLFLSSGLTAKEKEEAHQILDKGTVDLAVGTHALIQKEIKFHKLGLLIIDEQHKFGVAQRASLKKKGKAPHVLIMTATPIPRTLALTVFGDLDISTIDEFPPGRRPIKTILKSSAKIAEAFEFIRQKMQEGRQAYFVYPLIEDMPESFSENEQRQLYKNNLKSATTMAKYLQEQVFGEYQIALLHGDMPNKKKEKIMGDFRNGRINILVSTVVIEVGIDVPNASVMVIEHAERYGLAQLHQLRGRIGRGAHQSYCLMFGEFPTPQAERRLKIMEETCDGFRIAEEDLRIRGPGEFLGIKQSGIPEFRITNLASDLNILKLARADAQPILKKDPLLLLPDNKKWLERISVHFGSFAAPLQ